MTAPIRIQRQRVKGWRMPPNTIYVGRPSCWGNPFHFWMGEGDGEIGPEYEAKLFREWIERWDPNAWFHRLAGARAPAVANAKVARLCERRTAILDQIAPLRGKNLACWCPRDRPCHADVLLELANR